MTFKLNELELIQQAIVLLENVIDATPDEIIECLEQRLISKKEAEQILESLK